MSDENEPVKNPESVSQLKEILENHSQIQSVNETDGADLEASITDYDTPVYFTIQTQVKKQPEIGFYELYVFHGSPSVTNAKKMGVFAGKSVQETVDSFFNSFNEKK